MTRIAVLGALSAATTLALGRDNPPSIHPPVPLRTPKQHPGTTRCGCGRVISGNKLTCKACGDAIVAAINALVRKRAEEAVPDEAQ